MLSGYVLPELEHLLEKGSTMHAAEIMDTHDGLSGDRQKGGVGRFDVPVSWSGEWPCSNLTGLTVEVTHAANGDLVDLTLWDGGEILPREDERVESLEAAELAAVEEKFLERCPRCDAPGYQRGYTREGTDWKCEPCGLPFLVIGE